MRRGRWCAVWLITLASSVGAATAEDGAPALSGRLLYSRLTDGTWQIWRADLATAQRAQLTFSPGDKRVPVWTPDGQAVYCTTNQRCYRISLRGQEDVPVFQELWPIRDLVWSAQGGRLVFSKFRTDLVDSANLYVVEGERQAPRLLTHEAGLQYHAAWSPDGSRLVYVAGHGYGTHDLYVTNADGTDQRRLTSNPATEAYPVWSPDGSRIAFASDLTGDYEIWVMRSDGSGLMQLTHKPGLDTRPAWSPDGSRIAFTTNRAGRLEIWVMESDGTGQRLLEGDAEGQCDPAWR